MHAHFLLDHSVVELVSVSSVGPQLISNQVLRPSLAVLQSSLLEIVVRREGIAMTEDLRLGTEVLLLVLREVIDSSLFLVQGAQVLIVVRVLVVIEGVHPLVGAVDCLRFVRNLHTALVQDLVYVFWVQVLKVIEIYGLEQLLLILCKLRQTLLLRELLKEKQLLSRQLDGLSVLVDKFQDL